MAEDLDALLEQANDVYADYEVAGVPATGEKDVEKPEVRALWAANVAAHEETRELAAAASVGLRWTSNRVRVRSTGNVALATALENGDTLNGVTLATGDHVFLGSQTDPKQNGIYTVVASGAASRATWADSAAELAFLAFVIQEGTAGAGEQWALNLAEADITVGTTSLAFSPVGIQNDASAEVIAAREGAASLLENLQEIREAASSAATMGLITADPTYSATWDTISVHRNGYTAVETGGASNNVIYPLANRTDAQPVVILYFTALNSGATPFARLRHTDASFTTATWTMTADGQLGIGVLYPAATKTANQLHVRTAGNTNHTVSSFFILDGASAEAALATQDGLAALCLSLGISAANLQAQIDTLLYGSGTLTNADLDDFMDPCDWFLTGAFDQNVDHLPTGADDSGTFSARRYTTQYGWHAYVERDEPWLEWRRAIRKTVGVQSDWNLVGGAAGGGASPLNGKVMVVCGHSFVENTGWVEAMFAAEGAVGTKLGFGGCRWGPHDTGTASSAYYSKMNGQSIGRYAKEAWIAIDGGGVADFSEILDAADALYALSGDDNRSQALALSLLDFAAIDIWHWNYDAHNDFTVLNPNPVGAIGDTSADATYIGAITSAVADLGYWKNIRQTGATATYRGRQAEGDGLNSAQYPNVIARAVAGGGNTGNGTIGRIDGTVGMADGAYTVTFTSGTDFEVTTPAAAVMGTGTVGVDFVDDLEFKITAGGTAFVAGDAFTITVSSYMLSEYNDALTEVFENVYAFPVVPHHKRTGFSAMTIDAVSDDELHPNTAQGEEWYRRTTAGYLREAA